jgi:hypothetical protein
LAVNCGSIKAFTTAFPTLNTLPRVWFFITVSFFLDLYPHCADSGFAFLNIFSRELPDSATRIMAGSSAPSRFQLVARSVSHHENNYRARRCSVVLFSRSIFGGASTQSYPDRGGVTVRCSDATGAQVYTEFANVPDAAQSTISNGVRLIRLNKTVFDSLSPLMQLFVYAHECGHHISGDIVEGVYFRHDNLAREQNADRIGIRLLRDQSGISLNQANEIAAAFQNNPAIPPYYLPGPLRAKWIVDCYQSHDDACKGSTVIYGGSPQP